MTFSQAFRQPQSLIFLFALILLCWYSCRPKCDPGYERDNGKCLCPQGRFVVGDSCVVLEKNQFYWAMDCPCFSGTARIQLLQRTLLDVPIIEFQLIQNSLTISVLSTVGDGEIDSISTGGNLNSGGFCEVQGKMCEVKFEGKLVHPDTLRGNLVYRWYQNLDSIVQKCPTQMWRK